MLSPISKPLFPYLRQPPLLRASPFLVPRVSPSSSPRFPLPDLLSLLLDLFLSVDSHNSEHSGSMNSEEFSNLIGHNYGNHLPRFVLGFVMKKMCTHSIPLAMR